MSVDFQICNCGKLPDAAFPVEYDSRYDLVLEVPWPEVRKELMRLGAIVGTNEDDLDVPFGDDGNLRIDGSAADEIMCRADSRYKPGHYYGIGISTYAYWRRVQQVYEIALRYNANLVIADLQEGFYHNLRTFTIKVKEQSEYQDTQRGPNN